MKPSRSLLSLLTVLLIFTGLAAGVAWRLLATAETGPVRPQLPDTEGVRVESATQFAAAQPVRSAEVIRDTLWIPVTATGESRAYRMSEVATRTAGVVERVFVGENDFVRRGDLLVQLDTTEAAMELERAESQHLTATV